ncbi:hypothetical protein LCGC14_1786590 [marine sediment metagenome]|uniref:Cobalt transport protein n=1 Tax=marine sediment metagenome TaxID=412755 RepID=A0A0F9HGC3_9ZZZZ
MVETFLQEKTAGKDGLLQALDARLKLIIALLLVVSLSFTHSVVPILAVYALLVALAYLSKLNIRHFILRSTIIVGFFSGLVMLPATLNIFIDGKPILKLTSTLAITDNGLNFLSLFYVRSLAMATTSILLILTTKREELLSALKVLRVPTFFTMTISLSYRFFATLVKVIENIHLARRSRTIKLNDTKTERRWVASRIGWTFKKAVDMSNEVTQAMISRGWQGE